MVIKPIGPLYGWQVVTQHQACHWLDPRTERHEIERPLKAAEQLILLSRCHYIWASSNPNDEMVLEEAP